MDHSQRGKITRILLPVSTFFSGAVISEYSSKIVEPSFRSNPLQLWTLTAFIIVVLLLSVISFILFSLFEDIAELTERSGLKIKYLQRDGNKSHDLYREAISIIRSAKKSINVLTYTPDIPTQNLSGSQEGNKFKEEYFSAFMERVKNGGIQYKRILQINDLDFNKRVVLDVLREDKVALEHYHDILDLKNSGSISPDCR